MFQSAVIRDEFAFTGHNAALTAVCFNRHQDCFVSADDSSLHLWRPGATPQATHQAQQRVVSLPPRTAGLLQALEYVDSRQLYVAAALDGSLKLLDAGLNELAAVFTKRATVLSLVFDASRGRLLSGGADGCAAWQVRGRPPAAEAATNPSYELAPLPGFFHYGRAQTARQRPGPRAGSAESAASDAWVRSVQLSADGSRLFAQSARHVDVFAAADGAFVERHAELFPDEYGALSAFALHERSQYLVCGTSAGAIFVLSVHPTAVVHAFKDHTAAVTSLAVLAASGLVLSSSLDGSVRLWDLEARRQVHRLDLGQPVQGLRLLPGPSAAPGPGAGAGDFASAQSQQSLRFYCRVRSAVRIFRIQSTIKEHMACLAPISILSRVPILRPRQAARSPAAKGGAANALGQRSPAQRGRDDRDSSDESDASGSDESDESDDGHESQAEGADAASRQTIVAAGTDKTVRLFAGRAPNEAPSFTWIPEEGALDLIALALHPSGRRLFLLLDSQKLLLVATSAPAGGEHTDAKTSSSIERVVCLSGAPLSALPVLSAGGSSSATDASLLTANSGNGSHPPDERRPSVFRGSDLPGQLLSPGARRPTGVVSSPSGRRLCHASVVAGSSRHPPTPQGRSGAVSAAASLRGRLCCLCVCVFPPVFHATPPLASLSRGSSAAGLADGGEALLAPATQAKWLSRTLTLKRQASTLAQELGKLGSTSSSSAGADKRPSDRERGRQRRAGRQRLVRSEWDWVACGSEFGHLLFWHSGLGDSDADAISIDAHDAAVVALAASQASALLVSLDAGHRAHLWHLQPVLALRHLLDLRDKPSCFVLSPRSELLLAGFDDGRVALTDASNLARVETYPFPFRGDLSADADDQQHSAMVSAGDFLDERRIVLTASVDAVVKVWDRRRNLLRQVAISSALTSLCFVNAHGDVMGGLPSGIFVLSRHDVLPEWLLRSASRSTRDACRSGSGRSTRRPRRLEERGGLHSTPPDEKAKETECPPSRPAQALKCTDPSETKREAPPEPDQQQPELAVSAQKDPPAHAQSSLAVQHRRLAASSNADALISRINDRPLAAASLLHAPVLRPKNASGLIKPKATGSDAKGDELRGVGEAGSPLPLPPRITVPTGDAEPPNQDDGDRDWRDSLLPVAPWRQLLNHQQGSSASPLARSASRSLRRRPWAPLSPSLASTRRPATRPSPPLRQASPQSLLHSEDPSLPLSCSSSCRSGEAPSAPSPAGGLGVGSWDNDRPVLYCKHQAPVAPKDKTPRKLWNAIGGEDRRLLALQRNLLPPC